MDSRKYSMYRLFFSIPEDAFILCIGFFYRFRKMLLEAEIIDSVFYVCHLRYTYIIHIYIYIYISTLPITAAPLRRLTFGQKWRSIELKRSHIHII